MEKKEEKKEKREKEKKEGGDVTVIKVTMNPYIHQKTFGFGITRSKPK